MLRVKDINRKVDCNVRLQARWCVVVRIFFQRLARARVCKDKPENPSSKIRRGSPATAGKTLAGVPLESRDRRVRSIADLVTTYLKGYRLNHRPQSISFAENRLAHVKRLLGSALLPDITEAAIVDYIETRIEEGASGRTINMELGELSRVIGNQWSILWPKIRKLEERKDVGKALSDQDERRLLDGLTADHSPNRSQLLGTLVRIALLTGMRSGEITGLSWGQVDFEKRIVTVGRAKTSAGTGRQIPIQPSRKRYELRSVRGSIDSCGLVHRALWGSPARALPVPVR